MSDAPLGRPAAAPPLWQPSPGRARAAQMSAFRAWCEPRAGRALPDSRALHAWSVAERGAFWSALWEWCGVVGEPGERALVAGEQMPGARWFPDARLNFAENLLRRRDVSPALVARDERGRRRVLTWGELHAEVARVARGLRGAGVGPGDRVAGYLPNGPEAVIAMLAAASLGAPWSSCSPDFGARGVLDRFGQITPRVLFAADGYPYAGKLHDVRERVAEIARALPSVERVVMVAGLGETPALAGIRDACAWEALGAGATPGAPEFVRLPFDHPLYVLYSSGTTGPPKCIVHGAGGTLLQHLKEQRLHADLRAGDRFFYYTTTGWMMWNWLASGLASEATLVLYDGSPLHPGPAALFDLAEQERTALFGVSAKFLDSVRKAGVRPRDTHDLGSMRVLLSTGSPLAPEGFDWVYDAVSPEVQLASISGGTDIVSCFVGGDPTAPVWRGECQMPGLGMAVDVFDEEGRPAGAGQAGELVCTRAFPSMPVGFWNDQDGARYRAAYFGRFPGVWHHGDFAEWTAHGGIVIHGRSDATLNPGGVRIGTAEIYRQVETLDEVQEAIVIGQPFAGDVRVVLFVRLREGLALDDALRERIRARIRTHTTPRHVPARIVQVSDIPRTRSGKIVELAVRDVVAGRAVRNREALANPEALALFADHPELRS
ncbi:MAG: acetoacetate--CoA ligase [Deltaproteobacteria bacterium]|nr:acetoacetate--CoA ligase [Deltaproteobacteria bacterium]